MRESGLRASERSESGRVSGGTSFAPTHEGGGQYMSHLMRRGRKFTLPLAGAALVAVIVAAGAFAAIDRQGKVRGGHADQGRGSVRLSGRVRRRSTGRTWPVSSPRCRSTPAAKPVNVNDPRKGWTGGSIGGHPLKLVGIGCSNDRRRHGHQGDQAAHGAARCRRDDRAAVGRRVDRGRQLREAAPDEDVRRRLLGGAGHDPEGASAELLPLPR